VLAVNGVLLLLVGAFLVYDYSQELNDRFDEKKTALEEEAKTLLPGVVHLQPHGRETVQAYVDDVCGRMDDADSPRHHIVVEMDSELVQAHAHHRQSEELVIAMKSAVDNDRQRLRTANNDLVVGVHSQDGTTVLVSEDVADIRSQVLRDEIRRMWALVLIGLIGAVIVNIVMVRMVSRPLNKLVTKVREVGTGNFSSTLGTFGSTELNFLSTEINAMSDALESSQRERKIRLNKARKIQENLLPQNHRDTSGIQIGNLYVPAEEVGGDFYDVLPCGKDQWLICVADATDHGVPAAMSAAMLKTLLLQAMESTNSPGEMLAIMNGSFMQVHLDGDFASIILVYIDLTNQKLVYANAGHDPAWLIEPNGEAIELSATGTLLGIDCDAKWDDVENRIGPRWRLAIATDGITETFNSDQQVFGRDRLLSELLSIVDEDAQKTADEINQSVSLFRGDQLQADDVTLLILDFGSPCQGSETESDLLLKST
jgi:sigma-B regulation protein RsbU (phosphoserine phosphatase)